MNKLRRVAEVGDGSYQGSPQQPRETINIPVIGAKRRKKKFASKLQPVEVNQGWERVPDTVRYEQKAFMPKTSADYNNYSPADVSGNSIKRYITQDTYDDTAYDLPYSSSPHMYGDVKVQIEAMLMESMEEQVMKEKKELEKKASINAQAWDVELNAWAQKRANSSTQGGLKRIANEQEVASPFGQTDIEKLRTAEMKRHQMYQNMQERNAKIQRKEASQEERRSQYFNQENIISQSAQNKFKNSKLMEKLSQLAEG